MRIIVTKSKINVLIIYVSIQHGSNIPVLTSSVFMISKKQVVRQLSVTLQSVISSFKAILKRPRLIKARIIVLPNVTFMFP